MAWAQLGPLALIEQRLGVGGASFRLLAPQDVDAVFDMYLDRGGWGAVGRGTGTEAEGGENGRV